VNSEHHQKEWAGSTRMIIVDEISFASAAPIYMKIEVD
jgi:hypothetical protein